MAAVLADVAEAMQVVLTSTAEAAAEFIRAPGGAKVNSQG